MSATLESAYARCEQITRTEARNFYYGIRLLPAEKRQALCAVYALARRVDDIGDGDLPLADKQQRLGEVRAQVAELTAATPSTDPVLLAVGDAASRLPIPLGAFDELVDGVEMDLAGRHYATFEELVDYCRCVAGSIGRLCLGVFGARDMERAPALADALGIALQQTNILRDIREDLMNGRVYLPESDLRAYGVTLALDASGGLIDDGGRLSDLVRAAAQRARGWYDEGLGLLPLLDRRSAASAAAMSGIYRRLLDRMEAQPALIRDRRLSLSGWEKATVAAQSLAGWRA